VRPVKPSTRTTVSRSDIPLANHRPSARCPAIW
jgi:hypothetical protein